TVNGSIFYNPTAITLPNTSNSLDLAIEVYSSSGITNGAYGELHIYRSPNNNVNSGVKIATAAPYFGGNYNYHTFYNINLNSSDFPNPGGVIYVEYENSAGAVYRSPLIQGVNSGTAPSVITNNIIYNNSTPIYYGQTIRFMGSSPNGGNGIFTYSWEKQLE